MEGFDTAIRPEHVFEGCRRLGVAPVGAVLAGLQQRSLGVEAVAPDGARSWVKVSALRGVASHPHRDAELAAANIRDVAKPALLASCGWFDDDRHWLALQTTLAPSPTVEPVSFAGAAAARVGPQWIAALTQALGVLRKRDTDRICISADRISTLIKECFGPGAPHRVDEWHCAHGDVHWSNMTSPDFMLLDWEHWGQAPCGYDAAHLLVFSCTRPDVVQMIETAFAADLDTPSGRVALLAVLARRFRDFDAGTLDPAYKPHVEAMARRVLAGR